MATSKLQRRVSNLLSVQLGGYIIRENRRPGWLIASDGNRLELDFYLPELKAAIEVNGRQHYTYIPRYHKTYDDFRKQKRHDHEKAVLCECNGIALHVVTDYDEAVAVVNTLAGIKVAQTIHQRALANEEKLWRKRNPIRLPKRRPAIRKRLYQYASHYPRGIRKHLKKMAFILATTDRMEDVAKGRVHQLGVSLHAIDEWQRMNRPIVFDQQDKMLIEIAQEIAGG